MLVCHSIAGNEECMVPAHVHENVAALQCRIVHRLQTPFVEVVLPDGQLMRHLDQSASNIGVLNAEDQIGESAGVRQSIAGASINGVFHRLERLLRRSCIRERIIEFLRIQLIIGWSQLDPTNREE